MKIIDLDSLKGTSRQVDCPRNGFTSYRYLLERDGLGFTLTKTVIRPNGWQFWHYKNHLEACLCVRGFGQLRTVDTNHIDFIYPGIMYAPEHDKHEFMAIEEVELICVFNPPLKGLEVHQEDGSYVV